MALPRRAQFDYEAIVPVRRDGTTFECPVRSIDGTRLDGTPFRAEGLVGREPLLTVTDAGLTPDANPTRPSVMRAALTFTATARDGAIVRTACCHVDRTLVRHFQPRDVLRFTRTGTGGLALAAFRGGRLLVAIGAITRLPLGDGVDARMPLELVTAAEGVFRERDPTFEMLEIPVELREGDTTVLAPGSGGSLPTYDWAVLRGFRRGVPGTAECAALWLPAAGPPEVVKASAMLLADRASFVISRW